MGGGGYSIKNRHRRGSGNSLGWKYFWPEAIDFLKLEVVTGRLLWRMLPDRGQCQKTISDAWSVGRFSPTANFVIFSIVAKVVLWVKLDPAVMKRRLP